MNREHLRHLLDAEAAEVSQFHDAGFAFIGLSESLERIIQPDERGGLRGRKDQLVQRQMARARAALPTPERSGMVYQNATHHGRCYTEKLRPVFPCGLRLIYQLQICF